MFIVSNDISKVDVNKCKILRLHFNYIKRVLKVKYDFSHKSLLGNIDSVEELSVIFPTDLADLRDLSARQ